MPAIRDGDDAARSLDKKTIPRIAGAHAALRRALARLIAGQGPGDERRTR